MCNVHFISNMVWPILVQCCMSCRNHICTANQMTGFYMKCNTLLKWLKELVCLKSEKMILLLCGQCTLENGLPSQPALRGQRQQWKCHNNVWIMFKVNNKDTRTTSVTLFWCLIVNLNKFHALFSCFRFWLWASKYRLGWGLSPNFASSIRRTQAN